MDFFAEQDSARKKTRWLLLLFLLCVMGVVIAIGLLTLLISTIVNGDNSGFLLASDAGTMLAELPWALMGTAGALSGALILLASGFKGMQLRGGGGVVARDLGGRLIEPSSTDTDERKLLNVVEEMAISSGVPVPQVYVLDNEEGINAFAAGTEPGNAAIGVTRGCLVRLSRAELQGVIAHEFSHILNGDMKLNMRLIGWVFGLVVISILGRGLLESLRFVRVGGGNRRDNNGAGAILIAILALGFGLLIIGGIGTFFARLLQAAVSRQREFLADASAVQFTREPAGIAGALKKIGGQGSGIESAKAAEASHCFFADGGMFAFGFATHPPLSLRIKKIQKDWDGKFTRSSLPPIAGQRQRPRVPTPKLAPTMGLAVNEIPPGLASLSSSDRVHIERGQAIYKGLDESWQVAVQRRDEAQAVIFGLLLAQDEGLLAGEVTYLQEAAGDDAATLSLHWHQQLSELHSARKIALVDLAIPTLRNLSRPEYERFAKITRHLMASDGRVDLFEYMLQRLVDHHLESHFGHRGFARIAYTQIAQVAEEARLLYSAFARMNEEPAQAFASADREGQAAGGLLDEDAISLTRINAALEKLEQSSPLLKRAILNGCARAVASDGDLTSREIELLRAMGDSIGCAIPPFVSELALSNDSVG
ncbi:MAG: M48 family metallopeptidase [Verrucomicrobiota bacterium JB023]|nr:M48 family metallopeptidase [Verrucomicrobiota bacterium JB023]